MTPNLVKTSLSSQSLLTGELISLTFFGEGIVTDKGICFDSVLECFDVSLIHNGYWLSKQKICPNEGFINGYQFVSFAFYLAENQVNNEACKFIINALNNQHLFMREYTKCLMKIFLFNAGDRIIDPKIWLHPQSDFHLYRTAQKIILDVTEGFSNERFNQLDNILLRRNLNENLAKVHYGLLCKRESSWISTCNKLVEYLINE